MKAVESLTSIRADAFDATGSATEQGTAVMFGPAKVQADPRITVWSARRGSSTNARPDQIPDSKSSTEDYEDIVQVLQNNDAYEFEYSNV